MTLLEAKRTIAADLDAILESLARHHGTPLYVYDLHRLAERVGELRSAFAAADARLYFASMANDRVQVLASLARLGVGACVNSIPHLRLALDAGFDAGNVQFTSTGISREDMRALLAYGVRVNLDSVQQLETWAGLGGVEAGLRINAASLGRRPVADRIGIDARELGEACAMGDRIGCCVNGVHVYVGTNFQRAEEMIPTLDAFFELAVSMTSLEYLNIGGGIGVDYAHAGPGFDLAAFAASVAGLAVRLRERRGRGFALLFEPGRGLAADCGTFITSVTDVKALRGELFVAVDGSIAVFPRPFHHPDTPHRVRRLDAAPIDAEDACPLRDVVVVGRTTFSKDILGRARVAGEIGPGDLLAFDDAGAYSQSMSSHFLGQPEPSAVYLGL